jgi:hypothetical protein
VGRFDKDGIRRYRAMLMIDYKVRNNATNKQVAKEFKVSEDTVERTMTWARRAGLLTKLEDTVLEKLGPLAVETLEKAMKDDCDSQVALEVLNKMIFKTGAKAQPDAGGSELERYITKLRGGSEPSAIEGEIVRAELQGAEEVLSLPPGPADVGARGSEADACEERES